VKFHPYSEVFPLLEGPAFDELVADIKTNGLREKIWKYDGQILDGRNRFLACQRAKVAPEFRTYGGKDPLAFVISLNVARRHLTEAQRAMAAARIATLKHGVRADRVDASRDASTTQSQAAEQLAVSRSSVQRARKVVEQGSKALQQAVDAGAVALRKAAAVVDLPKSEQLAAATAPPEMPSDEEMAAADEGIEREYSASIAKVMEADDRLAAAHAEIKRQAAEIAALKISRDGFMNGKGEITRLLGKEQNKNERLMKENERLVREVAKLKERLSHYE